ncbi:MAG: hypothetical protein IKI83_05915 [Prevotella sp.]|nr:hypothetical protein [Prevotella sp.]
MQKKDKNNFIVRPNGEETRKCPHCHTEVEVQTRMCPTCNYSLHWMKSGQNISVDFLQSPLPRIMTICAIIVAVIGQLFIYFLDSSVNDYFVNRLSLPPISTLHVAGHIMKTIGETTLLYCLMKGLIFEFRNFTWHINVTMILLLCYHLLAAALPSIGETATSATMVKFAYNACFALLALSEASYFILGLRLNSTYFGSISTCGLLMLICSGLHFATGVIFNLTSKEFYSDTAFFVFSVIYLIFLGTRMLPHEAYMLKKEKKRAEAF